MQVPKTCLSNGLVQLKENDSGNAPILNYNLPQKSAFTSYSTNILKVPLELFSSKAFYEPTNKITEIDELTTEQICEKISNEINNTGNSSLIQNLEISNIQQNVNSENKNRTENNLSNFQYIAEKIKQGKIPTLINNFGAYKQKIKFAPRPVQGNCVPLIFVIEEYKTLSFLGDYGAG